MKALLSVLAVLAACGDSTPARPDAPDAPDGATVSVYVGYPRYAQATGPVEGAIVLFYDAAGTLVDRQVSGANGIATGAAPAGGTVTVLSPAGMNLGQTTWVDIAPGDHLFTTQAFWAPPVETDHRLAVTIPRDGDDILSYEASAVGFSAFINTPLAGSDSIVLAGAVGADAAAIGDLVVTAVHNDGHARFIVVPGATLSNTSIDLSASTWADPNPLAIAIENIPADEHWISAEYLLLEGGQPLWAESHYSGSHSSQVSLALDVPGSLAADSALALIYQREPMPARQHFFDATFNGAPATINLAALAPPDATAISAQTSGAVTWDVSGDPTTTTGIRLAIGSAVQGDLDWTVLLPPDRRAFTPPPVPADLAEFKALDASVTLYAGNEPGGYAALRTSPLVFDPQAWAQVVPATPGTYRIAGI